MAGYDHAASERARARLRLEHRVSIEWLPGAIEWSCSCSARSAVSGGYRTESQVNASKDRHLRAVQRRIYNEECGIFAPITIRRDHTFVYRGRVYRITQGSDRGTVEWDGYSIVAILSAIPGDEVTVEEGFWAMSDVRAYLTKAQTESWEYLPDVNGNDPHTPDPSDRDEL